MPVSWRDAATSAIIDDTTTADMADTDTVTAVTVDTVDTVDTADTVGTEVTATDWATAAAKNLSKDHKSPLKLTHRPIKFIRLSLLSNVISLNARFLFIFLIPQTGGT